jgi:hypothetical protein
VDLERMMQLYTHTTNDRLRYMTTNLCKRLDKELDKQEADRDAHYCIVDDSEGGERIYTHAPDDLFMIMTQSLDAALEAKRAVLLHAKVLRVILHRIERYQRCVVKHTRDTRLLFYEKKCHRVVGRRAARPDAVLRSLRVTPHTAAHSVSSALSRRLSLSLSLRYRYIVSVLHRHTIRTLSDCVRCSLLLFALILLFAHTFVSSILLFFPQRICVALVNDCDALSSRLTLISELEAVEAAVEEDPGAEDCLLDLQRTLRQQCATKAIDTLVKDIFAQPTIVELFRTLFDERGAKRRGRGAPSPMSSRDANAARRSKLTAALRLVCAELRSLRPLLGEIFFFRLLLPAAVDHATVSFFRAMYDQASSVKTALRKFLLNADDREGVKMDFEIIKEQIKRLIDVGASTGGVAEEPTRFQARQMAKAKAALQRKFDSQIFNDFCGLLTRDPAYLFPLVRKIVKQHPDAVRSILLAVQLCLAVRDDLTRMKKSEKASIVETCEREALNEVARQFARATESCGRSRARLDSSVDEAFSAAPIGPSDDDREMRQRVVSPSVMGKANEVTQSELEASTCVAPGRFCCICFCFSFRSKRAAHARPSFILFFLPILFFLRLSRADITSSSPSRTASCRRRNSGKWRSTTSPPRRSACSTQRRRKLRRQSASPRQPRPQRRPRTSARGSKPPRSMPG